MVFYFLIIAPNWTQVHESLYLRKSMLNFLKLRKAPCKWYMYMIWPKKEHFKYLKFYNKILTNMSLHWKKNAPSYSKACKKKIILSYNILIFYNSTTEFRFFCVTQLNVIKIVFYCRLSARGKTVFYVLNSFLS